MRTSVSHPLRIAEAAVPGGGLIGMTICPGKTQRGGMVGDHARDLDLDLDAVRDWGATVVVTLMEGDELAWFGVAGMEEAVAARGMAWMHLPIVDVSVPDAAFEERWGREAGRVLRAHLSAGERVLLHCRGGLGRTGTVAARLLVEAGVAAEDAIRAVRKVRPGAIEVQAQEAYVRGLRGPPAARD